MNLTKKAVRGSVRIYTVSADGKQMIESAANVGEDGSPVMRQFYFKRVM